MDDRQVAGYRELGLLIVPGMIARGEADELRRECERLFARPEIFAQSSEAAVRKDVHGNPVHDRLDPARPHSPLIQRFAENPSLREAAGQLFGEPASCLKDKIIFKPPGVRGYTLHQDFPYWRWMGLPADDMLTITIAVDPADRACGPLVLYPGLHHRQLPGLPDEPRDADPTAVDPATEVWCTTQPGDMVAFHSLTPHRSDPNRSDHFRRVIYLTYIKARHGDLYEHYQNKRFH